MSRFRPARASSPLRPALKNPTVVAAEEILNNSRSSIASAPELAALTPEDIEFIDTVISKAGPSATTFLTIFKAYNATLQERGIDPQHEVVYYGKLLKLGTLRGKNWGEKWEMVKAQQQNNGVKPRPKDVLTAKAPASPPPTRAVSSPPSKAKILTRLTGALRALDKDDDAFTLHSHQDDTESDAKVTIDEEPDITPVPPSRYRTRTITARCPTSALSSITNVVDLTEQSKPVTRVGTPALKSQIPFSRATTAWDAETSEATVDTVQAPPSIPPSYGAAMRERDNIGKHSYTPLRALARAHTQAPSSQASTSHAAPAAAREAVLQARKRKGSVLNEDDAWSKIKMAQDEKEADRFRDDRLLERHWETWRRAYQWTIVCQFLLLFMFQTY